MRYKDKTEARETNKPNLQRPNGVSDEQWNRALDLYEVARKKGDRFPELTVAQAALETGWFRHMSGNYNYFGQKASKSQKGSDKVTKEYEGNQAMTMVQKFRDYDSLDTAMEDRLNKWGSKYENANTVGDAIGKIWQYDPKTGKGTGYATDINYDKKITKILGMMGVAPDMKVKKYVEQEEKPNNQLSTSMQQDLINSQVKIDNTNVDTKGLDKLLEPLVVNNVYTPTAGTPEVDEARAKIEEEESKFEYAKRLMSAARVKFVPDEQGESQASYQQSYQKGGTVKPKEINIDRDKIHRWNLENNPERQKGETDTGYTQRLKVLKKKIEDSRSPLDNAWETVKEHQRELPPVINTLSEIVTSPVDIAYGLSKKIDIPNTQKYKSKKQLRGENIELLDSALDATMLVAPWQLGMKAPTVANQALSRAMKEVPQEFLFDVASNVNESFQDGGGVSKDPKKFFNSYLASDKFKKRAMNMGYDEGVGEVMIDHINNTNVVEQHGTPSKMKQFHMAMSSTPFSEVGSSYQNKDNNIIIDTKEVENIRRNHPSITKDQVLAHEYGHAMKSGTVFTNELNAKETNLLADKLKKEVTDQHSVRPDENYSDIQEFRYLLKQEGIHDASNENFTKEMLNKASNSHSKSRLLENYSEKDLIELMNVIASSSPKGKDDLARLYRRPNSRVKTALRFDGVAGKPVRKIRTT